MHDVGKNNFNQGLRACHTLTNNHLTITNNMACKGGRRRRSSTGSRRRKGRRRRVGKSNFVGGRSRKRSFKKSRIFKNRAFLLATHSAKGKKAKRAILKTCGAKGICTLSEIAKNVLAGNIPLPEGTTKGVSCKYKKALRALASRKVSTKTKQKHITGKWFGAAVGLASLAAPYIYNLFKKKKK